MISYEISEHFRDVALSEGLQILERCISILKDRILDEKANNRKCGKYHDWVGTADASIEFGVTPEHLRKLKTDGHLVEWKHYVDMSSSFAKKRRYVWNIPELANYFGLPPERNL